MSRVLLLAGAIAAGIAAAAAPFVLSDISMRLTNLALITAIASLGLTFAFGYAGLIALGQAAFVGTGAYASALVCTRLGWSPWLSLPFAVAVAGATAALIGAAMLRIKGHYLALATVGFNVSFELLTKTARFTGGDDGITSIPPFSLAGLTLDTDRSIYWLILAFVLATCLVAALVRNSHLGRNMIAVRDDEIASAAAGVDVRRTKVWAMFLAGLAGGLAGVLHAHHAAYISPGDFALSRSIVFLAVIIVGGETSIPGAIIGALFFTFLPHWLSDVGKLFPDSSPESLKTIGKTAYLTFFGLIMLATLILMPNGITGIFRRLRRK